MRSPSTILFLGTLARPRSFSFGLSESSARPSPLAFAPSLRNLPERWYAGAMRPEPVTSQPPFAAQLLAQAGALYNFARYLCRDPGPAEDLVQEAFARALNAEASFVAGSNLKAWLFRILRNAFLDGRRRERRNPVTTREEPDEADSTSEVWLRGDIELERLRGLVARDIEAALAALSDDARAVVLLDLEGFTETEIAAVMDSAVGTVKSRLARARAALREALKEYAQ